MREDALKYNSSDPQGKVNLIHLDDCIKLISQVILLNKWGEVYNGCADVHPTKEEFYTKASRALNCPPPVFRVIS